MTYERPGKINLAALKDAGVSIAELLRYNIFVNEFQWNVLGREPKESQKCVTIIDMEGCGLSQAKGEVIEFIKAVSAYRGAHYPERCDHIFIINAPAWFSWLWKMLTPFIDARTRSRAHIVAAPGWYATGTEIFDELHKEMDPEQIPLDYGGKGAAMGQDPLELELLDHVAKLDCGC